MTDPSESDILNCNKLAMDYLRQHKAKESFWLLKKAEDLLFTYQKHSESSKLWALTFNNLGCYYKKICNPDLALSYLRKALAIEKANSRDATNLSGTYLNICAIYSQIGMHKKAVLKAKKAIKLLEKKPNMVSTLVVAYYSLGNELKALHKFKEASQVFVAGLGIAEAKLGKKHPLTLNLYSQSTVTKQSSSLIRRSKSPTEVLPVIVKHSTVKSVRAHSTLDYAKRSTNNSSPSYFSQQSSRSRSLQLSLFERYSKVKNDAALVIQRAWKKFSTAKKAKIDQLSLQISDAERHAQIAIKRLQNLRSKKYYALNKVKENQEPLPSIFKSYKILKHSFCESNINH